MDKIDRNYLNRIRAGVSPKTSSLSHFISDETYINLRAFSYKGHEYQEYFTKLIQNNPNVDITAEKCSQIGLSEITYRIILGTMSLHPGYSVLLAMPSKTFAQEVLKTRISIIIEQSPHLNDLISNKVDSASVKMFNSGSILYALGASPLSTSSLINRPITLIVTDELDKCDPDIVTGFRSRQTHSIDKPRIAISTPTAPGVGINAESEDRQVHSQSVVCSHCGHEFFPDYYTHIKLPGFDELIQTLTKEKLRNENLNTDDAYFECPKCHGKPSLRPEHRRWHVEDAHLSRIHLRLTPFDAPSFISASDLVTSQLTYTSEAEFRNQALGLTSSLSDATINRADLKFTKEELPAGIPIAGLDLGKESYYLQGVLKGEQIFIHGAETIPVGELEERVSGNIERNKIASIVSDSLPFLDVVHRLAVKYPMFWGAVYSVPNMPQPELYKLKIKDEEHVRQVNIQKNLFMDHVAGMIASEQIIFKSSPFDETIVQHILDMRRVRDHRFSEMRYKWVKSKRGQDHFWHTLCYLVCASKLIQKVSAGSLPMAQMLSTVRLKKDI